MPITPHHERHFTASETVRDIVIGMSDGLTVPFDLAAGLSEATDSAKLVYIKGRFTGTNPLRSARQTALIGGLAATAAFILARLFKS